MVLPRPLRLIATIALVIAVPTIASLSAWQIFAEPTDKPVAPKNHKTVALRGRVEWLAEALKKQHGIGTVAEAAQRMLALKTADGHLYPIAEDVRGRAFRRDQRLRDMTVELLVRQYDKSPVIQIIAVRNIKPDGKYDVDYWCDICSIAMLELRPCDCCQAPVRLRQRKMKEKHSTRKTPASSAQPWNNRP